MIGLNLICRHDPVQFVEGSDPVSGFQQLGVFRAQEEAKTFRLEDKGDGRFEGLGISRTIVNPLWLKMNLVFLPFFSSLFYNTPKTLYYNTFDTSKHNILLQFDNKELGFYKYNLYRFEGEIGKIT